MSDNFLSVGRRFSPDAQVGGGLDLTNLNHPTMCEQLCHIVVLDKSQSDRWIMLDEIEQEQGIEGRGLYRGKNLSSN